MTAPDTANTTKTLLGIYLMLSILLFAYLLIEFWPVVVLKNDKQAWDGMVTLWIGSSFQVVDAIRLLIIVILSGAIGSYIHATTSFVTYVGNKSFVPSWTWWYLLRPFIGMALALVFYFVIRGGLLSAGSETADVSHYGIAAVAGLVGIFSKQATDKLEEVFTNLFRTEQGKGDDQRRDKLGDILPVMEKMLPLKKIKKVTLPMDKTNQDIKLTDLLKILDEGLTRVPIFDENNVCRYIIHQSLIYKYIARQSIRPDPAQTFVIADVTLEDFLAFDNVVDYVRDSLAFVPQAATLGDAQLEMEKNEDCQDVLVTTTGRPDSAVVGWLTNVDIARYVKV